MNVNHVVDSACLPTEKSIILPKIFIRGQIQCETFNVKLDRFVLLVDCCSIQIQSTNKITSKPALLKPTNTLKQTFFKSIKITWKYFLHCSYNVQKEGSILTINFIHCISGGRCENPINLIADC